MNSNDKKIFLVVDDDDTLRGRMEKSLTRRGYEVCCAANYDEAVNVATERQPDLAVLDLKMPGKSGLELLTTFADISPRTRAVILTGYGSITNAVEAIKLGAVNYVTKPADADQVLAALEEDSVEEEPTNDFVPPSLATAQWEHIQRVLASCDGNISEAARVLDIPRRTLQRKLKKLAP
ncbi:MAG: response regulator transcription factor [Pirellulaceae bacterium]